MLRLNLKTGPEWIDLGHGVRLRVEPLSTTVMVAARRDPIVGEVPDDADTDLLGLAMARAVARRVVVDWEGVGDAEGRPVPVSPEGIDALLELWPIFEAFQSRYLAGEMLLEQEKNGSAPLPTGTSAGAPTTARPARRAAPGAPMTRTSRAVGKGSRSGS